MDGSELYRQVEDEFGANGLERVRECLEILEGRRRAPVLHDDQEATRILFPGIRALPWHDTAYYPWAKPLEESWEDIRDEFVAARSGQTFAPYEDRYTQDLGWKGWETWHIYRECAFLERARTLCPMTVDRVSGSPYGIRECIFSVLTPGTHLKPHTGGVNLFLTVHLPLIVPSDCGLRVGDETREWQPGKLVIFDDSFIHEAWNRSKSDRVVLLWDIWHPDLTPEEINVLRWLAPKLSEYLKGH